MRTIGNKVDGGRLRKSEGQLHRSGSVDVGLVAALLLLHWYGGHGSRAGLKDRFRVRELCRPRLLSYLVCELRPIVRWRPRASVAVGGGRYSVGYSVAREHLMAQFPI